MQKLKATSADKNVSTFELAKCRTLFHYITGFTWQRVRRWALPNVTSSGSAESRAGARVAHRDSAYLPHGYLPSNKAIELVGRAVVAKPGPGGRQRVFSFRRIFASRAPVQAARGHIREDAGTRRESGRRWHRAPTAPAAPCTIAADPRRSPPERPSCTGAHPRGGPEARALPLGPKKH